MSSLPANRQMSFQRELLKPQMFTKKAFVATFDLTGVSFTANVFDVRPSALPFLREISQMYSRFKLKLFRYRFVTQVGTARDGSIWMGYQARSTDNLPSTLTQAQTVENFILNPVYRNTPWQSVPARYVQDRWYLLHKDLEDSGENTTLPDQVDLFPGRVMFGISSTADQNIGSIGFLEFEMHVLFEGQFSRDFSSGQEQFPGPINPPPRAEVTAIDFSTKTEVDAINSMASRIEKIIFDRLNQVQTIRGPAVLVSDGNRQVELPPDDTESLLDQDFIYPSIDLNESKQTPTETLLDNSQEDEEEDWELFLELQKKFQNKLKI